MKKLDFNNLPSLPLADRHRLPNCSAVYFVLNAEGQVLYIGQSISLGLRIKSHHRRSQFRQQNARVAWLEVPVKQLAGLESAYIAVYEPLLNGTAGFGGETEVVSAFVPESIKEIVIRIADQEDRSTSQVVRMLLEESPRIRAALRHNGKPQSV